MENRFDKCSHTAIGIDDHLTVVVVVVNIALFLIDIYFESLIIFGKTIGTTHVEGDFGVAVGRYIQLGTYQEGSSGRRCIFGLQRSPITSVVRTDQPLGSPEAGSITCLQRPGAQPEIGLTLVKVVEIFKERSFVGNLDVGIAGP